MKKNNNLGFRVILLIMAAMFVAGSSYLLFNLKTNETVQDQKNLNEQRQKETATLINKTNDLSAEANAKKIETDDINLDESILNAKQLLGDQLSKVYTLTKLSDEEKKSLRDTLGNEVADKLISFNNNDSSTGQDNSSEALGERAELLNYSISSGAYDYITNTMPMFLNVEYQSSKYNATMPGGAEIREETFIRHKSNDFYSLIYNLRSQTWELEYVKKGDVEKVETNE